MSKKTQVFSVISASKMFGAHVVEQKYVFKDVKLYSVQLHPNAMEGEVGETPFHRLDKFKFLNVFKSDHGQY